MPVSIHTDDNRSPRSELLSPGSSESSNSARFQNAFPSLENSGSRARAHSHSQSNSQPHSPTRGEGGGANRERRRRNRQHSTSNHQNSPVSPSNGHTNGNGSGHTVNKSSKSWWRSREQELVQADISKQELIRMVVAAERETSKLHSTLTNTLTLLDTESHKAASLERDTLSTFTHLTNLRETAESVAERTARDLRVVQFELEHKTRECERLTREVEAEKQAKEEVEREIGRVKDAAWKIRRERMMDRAREEGRREGFQQGFMKAQAENALRMQIRVEAAAVADATNPPANAVPEPSSNSRSAPQRREQSNSRYRPPADGRVPRADHAQAPPQNVPAPEDEGSDEEGQSPYHELNSLPIVTPPQGSHNFPNGHSVPMRTGYSPTQRPRRNNNMAPPDRGPTPSVDRYAVSIPPQDIIEQTTNIIQPPRQEEWVTGAEHSAVHGRTPERPSTLIINTTSMTSHDGHAGPSSAGHSSVRHETNTSAVPRQPPNKPRVKFRRPSLTKTKQTAASWYRSLSFRKKPKQKVLIDPEVEGESAARGSSSNPVTPADDVGPSSVSGHGHEPSVLSRVSSGPPPMVVNVHPGGSQRHSRTLSAGALSGVRARDYAYPPAPGSNRGGSQGKGHNPRAASVDSLSTSQFDLLSAPGGGAYPRGGQAANTSMSSLGMGAGGKAHSVVSGKSVKSQIGKKLSMIKENPTSRDATPMRLNHGHQGAPGSSMGEPLMPPIRPFANMDSDRRSTKSARSTNSRMVAVNPDPESPDWPAAAGPSGSVTSQQHQRQPSGPYARPPENSALLRPQSGLVPELPLIAPLRTKKSGLSNASSGGTPVDTPTPMPKGDKGKGKEKAHPTMIGEAGSGHDASPGIGIAVQTPSTGELRLQLQEHYSPQPIQDSGFLSPKQSSTSRMSFSRPGTSLATSTTKVAGGGHDQDFIQPFSSSPKIGKYPTRSISPIPRSSPKIFQAQEGEPDVSVESVPFEEARKPKVTIVRRVEGSALFGGGGNQYPPPEENGAERWTTDAGMTPGPTLFHPLPGRPAHPVPPHQTISPQAGGQGFLQPGQRLHRAGSDSSLRSQGSYGKFDSSTYVDPAFWSASGPVPVPPGPGIYGRAGSNASVRSGESKRISYAD